MTSYTAEEYADMVIMYGKAGANSSLAVRMYAEKYPNRERHPSAKTIYGCVVRLRETGSVFRTREPINETPSIDVLKEEQILDTFAENPDISVREIAEMLNLKPGMVLRTLQENGFDPSEDS